MAAIGVPTGGGIGRSLTNWGMGVVGGIAFNLIGGFTGSGIIASALTAALTGAIVRGSAGETIATVAGFNIGQRGLGGLGLGNINIPGLGGGNQPGIETI